MRIKKKAEWRYLYVDDRIKRAVKYMAYASGVQIKDVVRMAILEYADRHLPIGWEEVSEKNENPQDQEGRTGSVRDGQSSSKTASVREIRGSTDGQEDQ